MLLYLGESAGHHSVCVCAYVCVRYDFVFMYVTLGIIITIYIGVLTT